MENLFYCFNKEEISLIKELKEKEDQDIRNGVEEQKDELQTLYKKVEINIIGNEKNFTDYIVLYLPNNFNQLNSVKYEYTPMFTKIRLGLNRCLNNINYAKKNNILGGVKSLDIDETDIDGQTILKSNIEFNVTQKDIERNIIIIEASYNVISEDYYGFYDIRFFNQETNIPISI